jgi:hypothetical protein
VAGVTTPGAAGVKQRLPNALRRIVGSLVTLANPILEDVMAEDINLAALAELISRLNPYTNLPVDDTGVQTGKMQIAMLPAAQITGPSGPVLDEISRVEVEVERGYDTKWSFKGQQQFVKAAVRIPYRFEVKDKDGQTLYFQTEYLLVGYAGAEGGG